MDPDRLLDGLDPAQRRAVTSPSQPLAILAGAGSGKTRVLTRRIAYRCLTGSADARHVLALTFTRKAASELDSRLAKFGFRDLPATGTFHALAYAQLRVEWAGSGVAAPVILDRKGRILARVLGSTTKVTPAELEAEIEWAKARLVTPPNYAEAAAVAGRRPGVDLDRIAAWFAAYEAVKSSRGLVDFDDLLIRCTRAIGDDPSFARAQRWRFRHLFVDEYQDVNPLQERLLAAWLGDRPDLCVVGDANQAIYGWNGADARYLERFGERHPHGEVIELTDNYRSTPQVLAVAATVLAGGSAKARPQTAHRPDGPIPVVVGYKSDTDEAHAIARAVRDHSGSGHPWSAQAVLVRTNAQIPLIEQALRRAGVPCRTRGARAFLDDPHVKDVLTRFGRMREPLATTISDLDGAIATSLRDDPTAPPDGPSPDTAEGRRLIALSQVVALARELLAVDQTARTDGFEGWLRTVLTDDGPSATDAVTICSFHAAKGLEWEVVHLAGIEAGLVPITHARTPEAQAEERRLFYVAVTRATNVLRCSWAARRSFGSDPVDRTASPYLAWVREAAGRLGQLEAPADPGETISHSRATLARLGEERSTLADSLRRWRANQARAAAVFPTVVLSDRAVDAIVRSRPATLDELTALAGIGPMTVRRHGDELIRLVAEAETA